MPVIRTLPSKTRYKAKLVWIILSACTPHPRSEVSPVCAEAADDEESMVAATASFMQVSFARPGTIDVPPQQLVTYIATGELSASLVGTVHTDGTLLVANDTQRVSAEKDPYQAQAEPIIDSLKAYIPRLDAVRKQADEKYKEVQAREVLLAEEFEPIKRDLDKAVEEASNEAAKAEAQALLERMTRVHYEQKAVLERSANYWQERLKCERELTKAAAAQNSLEMEKEHEANLTAELQRHDIERVREEEKGRLDAWVQDFAQHLKDEEQKGVASLLAEGSERVDALAAERASAVAAVRSSIGVPT